MRKTSLIVVVFLLLAAVANAQPVITNPAVIHQELSLSQATLRVQPSSTDLINGQVGTKISGGFHPANSNPLDQEPAFTDGNILAGLSGLLNDFPGQNTPAWSGFWTFGAATDIAEIRVFSGNLGKDGRIFQHYDAYVTADTTVTSVSLWTPLIAEVIPAPFGTLNPASPNDFEASLTVVQASPGAVMATGVTGVRFDLYAVSNTADRFQDDWDAATGDDRDGFGAAFESPLIYEIDIFATEQLFPPAGVQNWNLY